MLATPLVGSLVPTAACDRAAALCATNPNRNTCHGDGDGGSMVLSGAGSERAPPVRSYWLDG